MRLTRRGRFVGLAAVSVLAVGVAIAVDDSGGSAPDRRTAAAADRSPAASPTAAPATASTASATPQADGDGAADSRSVEDAVAATPTGHLHVLPGRGRVVGSGPLQRYRVAVEGGLHIDRAHFARMVRDTLGDRRDWGRHLSFQRVSGSGYAFTVVLASPHMTDRLCAPLQTGGIYSCYNNGRSVINSYRWRKGAASYGWSRHLGPYRHYVIGHEVGHALGHGHEYSCRSDGLAPVMMQQTKSLYGCGRNPWVYP